jgi:hypothetical protein
MVEITIPIVLQFIQTSGIIVCIFYYIMNLRYTRKNQQMTLATRQAQILHRFWTRAPPGKEWNTLEFVVKLSGLIMRNGVKYI